MKQKNLILVAVAVGCGLVAAFLTSQIGAKPVQAEQTMVPVAAKELPLGTKLSKDDIDKLVVMKAFSKDSLPVAYASTKEEMVDKWLSRTIRAGEPFNPQDLTLTGSLRPPAGYNLMTIPTTADKSGAGFITPGSKVDIMCSVRSKKTARIEDFPLLVDMLVLAVDSKAQGAEQEGGFANMRMVSLAVTPPMSKLISAAINRQADLRLILRNSEDPPKWEDPPSEEEIWAIFQDEEQGIARNTADVKPTTLLPVPVEDLAAGTELTPEVIANKFKMLEIPAPAPTQFTLNLNEHAGRFVLRDLYADQFVPRSALGERAPTPKPAPGPEQTPTEKPQPVLPKTEPSKSAETAKPEEKKPEEKPVYYDVTISKPDRVVKYRYQLIDGEYLWLGEVKEDGSVVKTEKLPNQVTPPPRPTPGTKKEPSGRKI